MRFPIPFTKMSGTGNDFIIIDHRDPFVGEKDMPDFVRAVCRRKFSVGADGLIFIEHSDKADFAWKFFNGDGSVAEMCGNGARCAARYAFAKEIAPASMRFLTVAGEIEAQVVDDSVKLRMTPPEDIRLDLTIEVEGREKTIHHINTGVPHVVHFVDDIKAAPVETMGRFVRFHEMFQPAGTNVNFVGLHDSGTLHVRTYERGVEGETLACGTGAVASAIIAGLSRQVEPPVSVVTSGGEKLIIHFFLANSKEHVIKDVYLEGPANFIYEGLLAQEAV